MKLKDLIINKKEKAIKGFTPYIEIGDIDLITKKYLVKDKPAVNGAIIVKKGDILISTVRPSRGAITIVQDDIAAATGAFTQLRSDPKKCLSKYLFYSLNRIKFFQYLDAKANGVAYPTCSTKDILNYEINVPHLEEQIVIINKLDKLAEAIESRKLSLINSNELIDSMFFYIFGNPQNNEKGFNTKKGKYLFELTSGKFLNQNDRKTSGYPVYGGNGINSYADQYLINFRTIIIGRVGAYCGNVKISPEKSWITDNAIYIKKFISNEYDIDFLYYLMSRFNFYRFADFSGQPKISQKPILDVEYILPPLNMQKKFVSFVNSVEKQKTFFQKDIENLEEIYDAKTHEFFD